MCLISLFLVICFRFRRQGRYSTHTFYQPRRARVTVLCKPTIAHVFLCLCHLSSPPGRPVPHLPKRGTLYDTRSTQFQEFFTFSHPPYVPMICTSRSRFQATKHTMHYSDCNKTKVHPSDRRPQAACVHCDAIFSVSGLFLVPKTPILAGPMVD